MQNYRIASVNDMPRECCMKFLYAALMCAGKLFMKYRKFRHLA